MNLDPIGVLEDGPRKLREGHICRYREHGDFFTAYCEGKGCQWSMTVPKADREIADYNAYRHRTDPRLLLPGTSDIYKPTRMRVVNQLMRRGKL